MRVVTKLLVIAAHFPPTKSPEADHAFYLCNNLLHRGFQIDVLTSEHNVCTSSPGINVHPIMRDWSWTDLPRLIKFLSRCAPDKVLLMYIGWIYNEHPMVTYAASIAKRLLCNVTFITQFESAWGAQPQKTSLLARAIRKGIAWYFGPTDVNYSFGTLLRDSDRIIVLSHLHRAMLVGYYAGVNDKAELIPPPALIHIDSTQNARQLGREALGVAVDEILIAYFGYIYQGKGIETLLKAFKKVDPVGRRARLILIGGTLVSQYHDLATRLGPSAYRESMNNLAKELGIQDRLVWTGGFPWDGYEASRYLQAADICVLPFDTGVYLNHSSFVAAAAHGLPIISTHGSMVEPAFLHTENVILCPPKDPDALAAAMETLIADPELRRRLSLGAGELTEEWFSWKKAVKRTVGALNGEALGRIL